MRRGFFLFLMVVLVLRGLVGTAMAAGMLAPLSNGQHAAPSAQMPAQLHHASTEHGDVQALVASPDAHPGHEEHEAREGHTDHPVASCDMPAGGCGGEHAHHTGGCTACEICHSAAFTPPGPLPPLARAAACAVPSASAQFDSAPTMRAVKPPIA